MSNPLAIIGLVKDLFSPAKELIDEVHTSDEERLKLHNELATIQGDVASRLLDYQEKLDSIQAEVVKTEANSQSWLTRNWRPVTMINFLVIINLYWFGIEPEGVSDEVIVKLFDIIQFGLGGYVVGRSVEKAATTIGEVIKKQSKKKRNHIEDDGEVFP